MHKGVYRAYAASPHDVQGTAECGHPFSFAAPAKCLGSGIQARCLGAAPRRSPARMRVDMEWWMSCSDGAANVVLPRGRVCVCLCVFVSECLFFFVRNAPNRRWSGFSLTVGWSDENRAFSAFVSARLPRMSCVCVCVYVCVCVCVCVCACACACPLGNAQVSTPPLCVCTVAAPQSHGTVKGWHGRLPSGSMSTRMRAGLRRGAAPKRCAFPYSTAQTFRRRRKCERVTAFNSSLYIMWTRGICPVNALVHGSMQNRASESPLHVTGGGGGGLRVGGSPPPPTRTPNPHQRRTMRRQRRPGHRMPPPISPHFPHRW